MRLSPPRKPRLAAQTDVRQCSLFRLAEAESATVVGGTFSGLEPELGHPCLDATPSQASVSQKFRAPRRRKNSEGRKPSTKVDVPPHSKLLVSREEAAAMLSISVRALDYLVANDRLSSRRIGSRVLIPIEDVRRFAGTDHPERMAG